MTQYSIGYVVFSSSATILSSTNGTRIFRGPRKCCPSSPSVVPMQVCTTKSGSPRVRVSDEDGDDDCYDDDDDVGDDDDADYDR